MICFKSSVKVHPDTLRMVAMIRILQVVHAAAPVGYDVTVTSGCDSKHKDGSKHYTGQAFDFRIKDFPLNATLQTWVKRIQNRLGNEFYVLLEKDHIHIQWNGQGVQS